MIRFVKFGKGGGGSTTTEVDIPEIFKPYLTGPSGVLDVGSNFFSQGGFGTPDKAGSTTQSAWDSALGYVNQLQGTLNPMLTSLFGSLQTPDKLSGEKLDAAINAATSPLKDQYSRVTVPTIEDAAIQAGSFGGSRQGIAEGLAKSELDKNIANIDSTMRYQAESDDINRQMQGNLYAAQFAPSLYNLLGTPSNILSSVGQQQDYFANAENKSDLNNLLGYGTFLRQFIPGTMSSTSTQTPGGSSFGDALAGGGTGALIGNMLFPGLGGIIGGGLTGALGGLFG